MNLVRLATTLKRLRQERGMTLEEVATRAGLTRGWLSKVENFRMTPSLQALAKISAALDVPMSQIFEGIDSRPALTVTRKGEGVVMRRDEEVSKIVYASLASARGDRNMDPFVLTVPPDDDRPLFDHGGEEFLLVLEGSITLDYGSESHAMDAGDSAYFEAETPHRVVCTSRTPARVLCVFQGMVGTNGVGLDGAEPGDA